MRVGQAGDRPRKLSRCLVEARRSGPRGRPLSTKHEQPALEAPASGSRRTIRRNSPPLLGQRGVGQPRPHIHRDRACKLDAGDGQARGKPGNRAGANRRRSASMARMRRRRVSGLDEGRRRLDRLRFRGRRGRRSIGNQRSAEQQRNAERCRHQQASGPKSPRDAVVPVHARAVKAIVNQQQITCP